MKDLSGGAGGRMKKLLLGTLIISLLINLGCGITALAESSVKDLEGIWVSEIGLHRLRETLSPKAGGTSQIIIGRAEQGNRFKLEWTNFHEGSWCYILALDRTKNADQYRLILGPWESDALDEADVWRVPLKLKLGAEDRVRQIIFLDNSLVLANQARVRIPVPWPRYVNRLVFAGTWKDERGKAFAFTELGLVDLPDGQFSAYKVCLDFVGATCDSIKFNKPNVFGSNNGRIYRYGFKRIKNELQLFGIIIHRAGYHSCEDAPMLILRKE